MDKTNVSEQRDVNDISHRRMTERLSIPSHFGLRTKGHRECIQIRGFRVVASGCSGEWRAPSTDGG